MIRHLCRQEALTPHKSAPHSENDLHRLASSETPSSAGPSPPPQALSAAVSPPPAPAAAAAVRRAGTPPAVPSKPASVTAAAAAAAGRHSGQGSGPGPVAVTARWLASPEGARRTSRPVSQPAAGPRGSRPVPPPRRPRSRDQAPDYVNWRLPGGQGAAGGIASSAPSIASAGATSAAAGKQTETVIRIGGGGRVERIEQRERRSAGAAAAAAAAESRRLSVQHRGVTPEGQLVANILSGTHTVPRPAAAFRRAASADTDRSELPGYMRPTISSRAARQADSRLKPEERRPPLSKQRSLSTSGLSATVPGCVAPLPSGKRRASVASEQPARAPSDNGAGAPSTRRPPPARPRGPTHTRAASEGPPERTATSPPRRKHEQADDGVIPEEATSRGSPSAATNSVTAAAAAVAAAVAATAATAGSSVPPSTPLHPVPRPVTVPVAHVTSVDTGVGQSDERLLSPGSNRRPGAPTRPLSPPDDPRRLKKTSQYECPSWSPMARHAEGMRLAFEMDLDGGVDDVFESPIAAAGAGAGAARPRPPPRLAKSASASQVVGSPVGGRERPNITIQVGQTDGGPSEEPRTPRKVRLPPGGGGGTGCPGGGVLTAD